MILMPSSTQCRLHSSYLQYSSYSAPKPLRSQRSSFRGTCTCRYQGIFVRSNLSIDKQ